MPAQPIRRCWPDTWERAVRSMMRWHRSPWSMRTARSRTTISLQKRNAVPATSVRAKAHAEIAPGPHDGGADLWRRTQPGDCDACNDNCNNHNRWRDSRKHRVLVGRPGEFASTLQGRDSRQFSRSSALLVFVSIVFRTLPAMAMSRLISGFARARGPWVYRATRINEGRAMARPVVGVIANTHLVENRFTLQSVGERCLRAVSDVAGALPLMFAGAPDITDIGALLEAVDGVLLTGARANVHPARF